MRRRDFRRLLVSVPAPDEVGAQRRAWRVVQRAFAEHEPARSTGTDFRPLVAVAAVVRLGAPVTPLVAGVSLFLKPA